MMAGVDELQPYLQNPNVRQFLNVISMAEGTDKNGYQTAFGGGLINDLSDHPRKLYDFNQTDGTPNQTSAAGRYQFIQPTWDDVSNKLGLKNFSPENQDLAAVELLRRNGSLPALLNGDFQTAIQKSGSTWASLPSSPYAQPKRSQGFMEKAINAIVPTANAQEVDPFAELMKKHSITGQDQQQTDVSDPWADILKKHSIQPAQPPEQAQKPQPEPSFVERAGQTLMDIPRQVGLTARYGIEGVGNTLQMGTEPIRMALNPALRFAGLPEASSTSESALALANALGLPEPQGANERVVGDIARTMAGAGVVGGGSQLLAKGATGVTQSVLNSLAANPANQIVSAAGAGGAGGAVREAGGGPLQQFGAAMLGGIAAPVAMNAGSNAINTIKSKIPVLNRIDPGQLEQQITVTLDRSGVDWSQVPEQLRQGIRQDVSQALNSGGDLSPDALRRLVDFRMVGATPTRGSLTLDPVQITREMNLAKTGANSTDRSLQTLPRIQNENNQALIQALNNRGATDASDAFTTGQRAINGIQGRIDSQQLNINNLYQTARDSAGRDIPLSNSAFATKANNLIDEAMVGGALPSDVRNTMNRIASGEVPFTVNFAEQLKTQIGKLQRASSDGQQRMALGLVRQALDDTPLAGNQQLGQQSIDSFNAARSANRNLMQWAESNPAVQAVLDGSATPDQFVKKFLTSESATVKNIEGLKDAIGPEMQQTMRNYVVSFLKDKALNGASDEVGKFSAANYAKALKSIGTQKLGTLFSQEEIQQLRSVENVARYTTAQPVGSAVNNSNSGAMIAGMGIDMLDRVGGKVPLGLGPIIQATLNGGQQSAAHNIVPSLVTRPAAIPMANQAIPASIFAQLLTSAVPPRKDERSR